MEVATAVRTARERSRLSKRELARRAGTSPAAIVAYESGRQSPSMATLQRVLAAAGWQGELVLRPRPAALDPQVSGRRLVEVLELADALPHRPASRRITYPRFPR